MLLTLKPPLQNAYPNPHVYSPPQRPPSSYYSPNLSGSSLPPLPDSKPRRMSTPHRGLPPPSAMALPNPDRGSSLLSQPNGQMTSAPLPPPPASWQHGMDESMRTWLQARAEEDRRKQEEERTSQERLKLEQRKVEQTMLRDSLSGGIPPHMVPVIFAGLAGGPLPAASIEMTQQYMATMSIQAQAQAQLQLQQQQQQQQQQQPPPPQLLPPQQNSPDLRRDARSNAGPQPNPYGAQQQPAQHGTGHVSSYQTASNPSDRARIQPAPPTSAPRPPPQSALPRLNTGEMQIQGPPVGMQASGQHPLQQSQTVQQSEQLASSPSIFFHHWQPPSSQTGSKDVKDPQTSSGKSQQGSPPSQNSTSHLRSDYTSSPKKRKATGTHHAAPAPSSSNLPETSPSFSYTSSSSTPGGGRGGHSRRRSGSSSRAIQDRTRGRPRQQSSTSEAESVSQRQASVQPETRHPRYSAGPEMRRERGTPKRESEGLS